MKTIEKRILICQSFLILAFLIVSCEKDESIPTARITEFSPTSGVAGTTVVITGKNFHSDPAKNTVHFNGTQAEVSQASTSSLTVTVPDNATTGKISVTVHGKTVISQDDFVVLEPSITGFSPSEGIVGTTVTITGKDFSPVPAENTVKFNGITAEVTQASSTSLTVTVPEGATTGKISVTVHGKTLPSQADFIVLEPSITGFTPAEGIVGTTVTITGTDFSPVLAENIVTFNGVNAEITQASTTSLTVTVPGGATTGKISVISYGKILTSNTDFTVRNPSLSGFSPTDGAVGTIVTITGNDFSPVPSENMVRFNGVSAEVTQASTTSLIVTVPDGATTGKISVTTFGKTLTSDIDFTVAPSLSGFSPIKGVAGTTVTITGNNFSLKPAENIVKFNGVDAEVTQASTTSLKVTVPTDATTGKISITVNGKNLTSDTDFTVLEPSITTFFPTIGSAGVTVRINGENFSPVASQNIVTFDGTEAVVTEASSTELVVSVPAGASTGKISVKVGLTTANSADDFSICNGKAELIIFNLTISQHKHPNYTLDFDLINVGSEPIDIKKESVIQFYLSADPIYGDDDQPYGGSAFFPGGVLASGATYHQSVIWTFSNASNYPYIVVQIKDWSNPAPECTIENNVAVVKIE